MKSKAPQMVYKTSVGDETTFSINLISIRDVPSASYSRLLCLYNDVFKWSVQLVYVDVFNKEF